MEIEVDFKQLLEDISYTNQITKTFDVNDIITLMLMGLNFSSTKTGDV